MVNKLTLLMGAVKVNKLDAVDGFCKIASRVASRDRTRRERERELEREQLDEEKTVSPFFTCMCHDKRQTRTT